MKKLLSMLTSLTLAATTTLGVVSCSESNGSLNNNGWDWNGETVFPGGEGDINTPIKDDYKKPYNYQTGPSSSDGGKNYTDEFVTSFNVSSESTYSSYNLRDGDFTQPEFNGNIENFLKTGDDSFSLTGWQNDDLQFQNVLHLNKSKSLEKYKNLKVEISDATKGIDDSAKIIGKASFEKYMLTNTYKRGTGSDIPSTKEIQNKRQYVPDAIWGDTLESPYEIVNPSSEKDGINVEGQKVGFDTWNIWCSLKTPDNSNAIGNHNVKLTISYDYDGESLDVERIIPVKVENHRYTSENIYDQNGDGKVTAEDSFGFSAGVFPTRSQKFWTDGKYKDVPNYDLKLKKGQDTYTNDVENSSVLYGKNDLSVTPVWISNGAKCDLYIKDDKVSLNLETPDKDFISFYEVYKGDKLLATYSVYNNEAGTMPTSEAYNDANNKNDKIDVNGDGIVDSNDWDVNGDGEYTQEDWGSAGVTGNDAIKDQIGPNADYANFVMNSGKSWSKFDSSLKPLEEANSMFLRGNGYQEANNNQLIQVSGNLVDKSYNKNEWSDSKIIRDGLVKEVTDQINNDPSTANLPEDAKKQMIDQLVNQYLPDMLKSSPQDDYEGAFNEATKNDLDLEEFLNSTKNHEWNWKFDFSGLDNYMREAASKDMYQILINPIDAGASFNFWYLKDDNKIGPLRTIAEKMVDPDKGTLTAWGETYLKNIFPEYIKQLSTHMKELSNNPDYQTKDRGPVKIYIQFDEDNEKMVDEVMNVVHQYSDNIYSSVYLGWRSDIDGTPSNFWKLLERDFNNSNMDQIVINYDRVCRNVKNKGLERFSDLIRKRNLAGKTTMIYTAFVERPGLFAASDLSAAYWNMFFNFRLGTNGYVRWGYDFLYNDYFNTSVIEPNRESGFSSGESFLEYSGDGNEVHYSTRMLALINAEHYVNKAKQIIFSGSKEFGEIDRQMVMASFKAIGIDNNEYLYDNNDYKYNINNMRPTNYAIPENNKYKVTVPKQIYSVVKTIDWI